MMGTHVRAALATELPSPDLLLEAPHGRTESVINRRMWKHILVQGCYQILVLFLVIFGAPKLIEEYAVRLSLPGPSCSSRPLTSCSHAMTLPDDERGYGCKLLFCLGSQCYHWGLCEGLVQCDREAWD